MYRGFSAVKDNGQNMENFLEVTRKKTRPTYKTDTELIEMDVPPTDVKKVYHFAEVAREYLTSVFTGNC